MCQETAPLEKFKIKNYPNYELHKLNDIDYRVWSISSSIYLKPQFSLNAKKHPFVNLYKTKFDRPKKVNIRDIVAECYFGEKPFGYQVHNKDGNKLNWTPENLEYSPPITKKCKTDKNHFPLERNIPIGIAGKYVATVEGFIFECDLLTGMRKPVSFETMLDDAGKETDYVKLEKIGGYVQRFRYAQCVLWAYQGKCPYPQTYIKHLDGNRHNHRPDNLQYVNPKWFKR